MKRDIINTISKMFNRNLIQQNSKGKVTYFQIAGIAQIAVGIIYLLTILFSNNIQNLSSERISIAFFITMLGVAFAFPDLLKGQTKELSTMRIIVFMFANVICMLLLKIGWNDNITSLSDIGLDYHWVGFIAFLFGAKATQRYFENAKSPFPQHPADLSGQGSIPLDTIAISQLAKVQNEEELQCQNPNIEFISDTIKNGESCITIYLKNNNEKNIPDFVEVQLNENNSIKVQTEIIMNVGDGTPQYGQLTNDIVDPQTPYNIGSICCTVGSIINPKFKGVVTSGHVFTSGKFEDYDGFVEEHRISDANSKGKNIGKLYFQQMTPYQDLAIVELKKESGISNIFKSFPNGFYKVALKDLKTHSSNITILSKENNERDAFLLDQNVSFTIYYRGIPIVMRNIILIGSANNKNDSKSVTEKGDSGSCVFHKETGNIIGMVVGGNNKFSFVLPFKSTLINNNFKIS